MEKDLCIKKVPQFTIKNSKGANIWKNSNDIYIIHNCSELRLTFLPVIKISKDLCIDFCDRKSAIVVRALLC